MKLTTLLTTVLVACAPAAAQSLTIERLAPRDTIVVFGVDNFQTAYQHWNATTFPKVFEMEPVQKMEQQQRDDAEKELGEYEEIVERVFEELGIEEDPYRAMPTGAAGFAMFLHTAEDASRRPGMVAFADYGEHADVVQKIIDRLLEKVDEDDTVEYEVEDMMGRQVYSFTMPEAGNEDVDDALGQMDPGMGIAPMLPIPSLEDMFGDMDTVHFARDGNVFYISTELTQLTDSFVLVDDEGTSAFVDTDDYQGLRSQIGDNDAYGMLFVRPIFRLMAEHDPGSAMMQGMITSILGDIKGLGLGMRLDGRTAMAEAALGVYMPGGKSGITMLLDRPAPRGDLPAFVGPGTISFSSVNFDMSGFADFIMGFIRGNPFLAQQMGQEAMPMIEDTLESLSAALGNQLYTVQTMERPITLQTTSPLIAARCTDPQKLENTVAQFAGQMGLQPRDFLGNRIYSMDPQMAAMMGGDATASPALGIGGGYAFIGTEALVQQALRSAGQAGQPTLATEPSFERAVTALSDDNVIAWGFSELAAAMEMQLTAMKLQQEQQIEQMRQWDPEFAAEMEAEMTDPTKHWDDEDWARLRELIGPQAWQLRSTDTGFVMKFYQHRGTVE